MPTTHAQTLNPGGFFEFDLSRGAVHTRDGDRVLLLSDAVLAPLIATAVGNGDLTAVRKLGRLLGESTLKSVDGDASGQPAERVLSHAAGVLSLFGWGRLRVEHWGDAVVARLADIPELDEHHLGVAALLGGLFSAIADEEVACVPVSEDGAFLLVDPQVAQQVWKWSKSGDDVAAVVGRLAAPGDA